MILHVYIDDCECMCDCVMVSVIESVSVYVSKCMSESEKIVMFGRLCVYV